MRRINLNIKQIAFLIALDRFTQIPRGCSVTGLEWEWVWARNDFFFCVFMVANHRPCIHKQKQEDNEHKSPILALKKTSLFQESPHDRADQHG